VFQPVTVKLEREQQNYVRHCWLSDGNATVVLVTDQNDLVLVQNFEEKVIIPIRDWGQSITAISSSGQSFMIGGDGGSIRLYHMNEEGQATLQTTLDMGESSEILAFDRFEHDNFAICLFQTGKIFKIPTSNFETDSSMGGEIVPSFHMGIDVDTAGVDACKSIICMSICKWKPILATGGADRTLRIWDLKKKKFTTVRQYEDDIVSVSLHPMSLQILLCCKSFVLVSEVLQDELSPPIWRQEIQTNGSSCFSNGGHYFALSVGDFVQIYNTFTHEIICTLRGHTAPVQSICWKNDDLRVATIGRDGAVCIWDTWLGKRIFRYSNETQVYTGGFLTEDFSTAVINTTGGVEVLDIHSKSLIPGCDFDPLSQVVSCVKNNVVVLASKGSKRHEEIFIRSIFDHSCGATLGSGPNLCFHSQGISCAVISCEFEYLVTGSRDGSVCISKLHHRLIPQLEYKYNEHVGENIFSNCFCFVFIFIDAAYFLL
jgi:WD40 repeat protein